MKQISLKVESPLDMVKLGKLITGFSYPNLVIALNGDLGAGKTTFTKGVGEALEIKRVINSPTFTIMKIYDAIKKVNGIEKLYHLDVYRIKSSADDFELAEYFEKDGLSIVEWSDIISDLLPSEKWVITITRLTDTTRKVVIEIDDKITNVDKLLLALEGEKYEIIY